MNDVVVDLDLRSAEEQALWEVTLDFFVGLLSSNDNRLGETDAPDMMVHTAYRPDGAVCKKLIFQDRAWAEAFLNVWEEQKLQARAA